MTGGMASAGAGASAEGWRLEHTYAGLPALFYARVQPTPVRTPRWVVFNRPLARSLGLNPEVLERPESAAYFTGNELPAGAEPLAQAYAGHQYGHFTGLGDGRAILLGEQLAPGGGRFDVQLKGSGPTPFSRRGDGRAALGPMLREYVISEAMYALGIPTTRSLAVVATGERVQRERSLEGAVLTRIAASHIRVGTFEWAAARGGRPALVALADYTMARHYPALEPGADGYLAFFEAVLDRQAALVARWLHVGFVHGVMNTDNMALSGETIDYGPCAFMDAYDPATVFSSIDHHGRYAYANQPGIAQWNLARLAEAMLPLFHAEEGEALRRAEAAVEGFSGRFGKYWLAGLRGKLGLFTEEAEDAELGEVLLAWMQEHAVDYTNTFRELSEDGTVKTGALGAAEFESWQARWRARLGRQPQSLAEVLAHMRRHNPAVIPRNHQVEAALAAATDAGDLSVLERLVTVLSRPFDPEPGADAYRVPPGPEGCGYRTFCGT